MNHLRRLTEVVHGNEIWMCAIDSFYRTGIDAQGIDRIEKDRTLGVLARHCDAGLPTGQ
ncbi:hypothetical protein [Rhodoferax sp.]|uniref:hypothetical protein n=1 Tax=Rhodoferax sp. TaxID=50421 RepID=UPI0026296501|nr:hypothetical protein [Rhodoferax sp.]MDD3937596.1 hypothetical protein [Rhodoferax sp.]